jgi:PBSX family phage terminase large subunit
MFDPNPLYYRKLKYFNDNKGKGNTLIMCDEGGSRSAKTWENIHFIDTYCDHNRGKKKDIGIFRDTLITCKDYTLKEFEKCYRNMGKPFSYTNTQKPFVDMYGNNIYFRGLADESQQEAAPFDLIYINEAIDISNESMISGLKMRCKDLIIFDWNPKYSDHWLFKYEAHPNCLFTHSTIRDNKHAPIEVLNDLLACDPNNPINVANGTVDEFRWKVYYLGLRCSPEGLIFDKVTLIDYLPESYDSEYWGIDFGFTNHPTAVVQVRKIGNNLYAKLHTYTPIDEPNVLAQILLQLGKENIYWADSADGEIGMINQLRKYGIIIYGAKKPPGSIKAGITILKNHKIHVVRDYNAEKEINNYKFKTINGFNLNEPIDKFNHFWDAFRYAVVSNCN